MWTHGVFIYKIMKKGVFFLIYPGDGEIFYCLVFSRIWFDKKIKFSNKNRKFFHSGIIPFLFFIFLPFKDLRTISYIE